LRPAFSVGLRAQSITGAADLEFDVPLKCAVDINPMPLTMERGGRSPLSLWKGFETVRVELLHKMLHNQKRFTRIL
jgi:hypothetical protein